MGFIVSGFLSGKVDARGVSVRGRDECPDTCLTGFSEIFGSNPTVGRQLCVYREGHCECTYSLGRGLHTCAVMPRLTQPSILCGAIK